MPLECRPLPCPRSLGATCSGHLGVYRGTMLTSPEAAAAAPWPGVGKSCLLELPLEGLEPLGFMAWEVMLSSALGGLTSAWISDDLGGRPLFHPLPARPYRCPEPAPS